MKKLVSMLALCGLISSPAMAVSFVDAIGAPGNVVTDYSTDGLLSFDLDFSKWSPVTLNYEIAAEDNGSPISFSAVIRNFVGTGMDKFSISLSMSSFDSVGTVTRAFGTSTVSLTGENTIANISFDMPEYVDFSIGAALGGLNEVDWTIDSSVLRSGDILSVTIAPVPEPETYAMLLAGLGLVGFAARRRRAA
ncbi:PEPxxWA-CTERM sorting domain-containing protein [Azoarcus communis]|uniref:PEP-CTERM sorting domain-containing protein n=1 Tax=Parazoarcus communis TaxID=41977 RepID=UPI001459BC8E|nr:PEP-CTERM sorting domain-containing protein [Parazoarcus communis]NMG48647.1 PEPxxWA-CTERM sorting domain-containing protein [Parazoarcus communis]